MKIRQKRVLAYVLAMVMVLNLCAVPVKAESVDEENPLTTQIMKTNISNSTMYFVYDSANKDYSYSLTITKDEAVNDITLDASKLCISASNGDDSLPIQEKTYTADSTSLKADYITSAPTYDNDFTIDGNSKDGFRIQLSDDKFAEKKNNSFILWCQNDSGDEWYYVATFKVSIEKYTIQYDFGGKGGFAEDYTDAPEDFYEGDTVTLPTEENIVAKDGYTFAGWYLNERYDEGSVKEITKDKADANKTVKLYAKWEQKITYSIKYQLDDTNSDTKSSTDIEELKSDFSARETAKPGYTFDGWYMEKNNEKVKITADNLEDNLKANTNITLYPKWYYTIKFETNTGETVTDQTVELSAEKSTDALSQITKNKYKFAGWYVKGTENKVDTIKDVTEKRDNNSDTVTLEAKWSFTIRFENATFSDSNKYPSNSKEYYYGQDISLPTQSEMTNAGEFQGWYTDESFTNSVEKITESLAADDSSEFTLYAKWISTSPSPSPSDNSLNQSPSPTKDPSPSVAPAPTVTPSVQPTESTDGIKINGKDVKNNQKISVCLGASITITASSKITIVPKAKKNQKKCLKVSVKNNKGTIKVKSLCRNAIKVIITVKSKKTSTTIWINTKVPTPKFKVKINKSRTKITISIKNKSVAKKIGCYTVEALNKNTKNKFVYIATNKFKLLGAGGRKYPTGEYKFKVRFWNTKKPVKKGKLLTKKYMYSEQVQKLKVR